MTAVVRDTGERATLPPFTDEHEQLHLGGCRGARPTEEQSDEGSRQQDQPGALGLVERRRKGGPDGALADGHQGLAW